MTKDHDPPPDRPAQRRRSDPDMAFTDDEIAQRVAWAAQVDAGLIETRTPPAPADAVAIRAANDALFRALAPPRMIWW